MMPIARVQLPDGRIGRFEVPDGTTPEQVLGFASQGLPSGEVQQQPQQPPVDTDPSRPDYDFFGNREPAQPPKKQRTRLQEAAHKLGVVNRAVVTGPVSVADVPNLAINVGKYIGGKLYGTEPEYLGYPSDYAKMAWDKAFPDTAPDPDSALETIGSDVLGSLSGTKSLIAGGKALKTAATPALKKVGEYLSDQPMAQYLASLFGSTSGGAARELGASPEMQIAASLGGGVVGGGVANKATQAVTRPKLNAETRKLAAKARDYGIDLSLDQVDKSRVRDTVQKASQVAPFSGVGQFQERQRTSWNKAVAQNALGNEITDLTPDSINKWAALNSDKFDSALKNTKVNLFRDDITTLQEQLQYLAQNASPLSVNRISGKVNTLLKDIEGSFLKDDQIVGINAQKISNLRSELLKQVQSTSGEERKTLSEMVDFTNDILEKSLSPRKLNVLKKARREYRNYKTIEPLLEKSTTGEINPTELLNRVKSNKYITASKTSTGDDPLIDLARIGKEFLPKKGGSDTFDKSAYAAGAVGTYLDPILTAKIAGGLGLNRAYQSGINQNQKLLEKAVLQGENPLNVGVPLAIGTAMGATQGAGETSAGKPPLSPQQPFEEALKAYREQKPDTSLFEKALEDYRTKQSVRPQSRNDAGGYNILKNMEQAESGGNPNAKAETSSASGILQFTDKTWRDAVSKWGAEAGVKYRDKNDPDAQRKITEYLSDDNARIMRPRIGRQPTNGEIYVAHFMGAGKAARLINNRDDLKIAAALFPKEAEKNRSIFYDKQRKPRTTEQVYQILINKVS